MEQQQQQQQQQSQQSPAPAPAQSPQAAATAMATAVYPIQPKPQRTTAISQRGFVFQPQQPPMNPQYPLPPPPISSPQYHQAWGSKTGVQPVPGMDNRFIPMRSVALAPTGLAIHASKVPVSVEGVSVTTVKACAKNNNIPIKDAVLKTYPARM